MIQSIERAAKLLHLVATYPAGAGVRELARAAQLKVPTAQNILKTLAALEFLEFDPDARRYRIGLTPLLLAEKVEPLARLRRLARPAMEALQNELHETITVCAMLVDRVLVFDSLMSNNALAVVDASHVVPHPHCMASGLVLLAHRDREFQQRYARSQPLATLQPNAPSTPERLLKALAAVKAQGYAEAIDVCSSGVGAVAVPVWGPGGTVAMTIGCSAPLTRFDARQRQAVRRTLLKTAQDLSKELGA
ncbi:MAG: IclR family transcriptional regulator [Lentisphaerae bacterium]|nr:IclR family transcriptional regulator [Lentisphaerota bacterium]